MDRTITLQLPNGASVIAEVETVRGRLSDAEEEVVDIKQTFHLAEIESAIEGIAGVVAAALAKVKPTKAAVEFGIEVGLESGKLTALLVKGAAKSNLKITLEWSGASSQPAHE